MLVCGGARWCLVFGGGRWRLAVRVGVCVCLLVSVGAHWRGALVGCFVGVANGCWLLLVIGIVGCRGLCVCACVCVCCVVCSVGRLVMVGGGLVWFARLLCVARASAVCCVVVSIAGGAQCGLPLCVVVSCCVLLCCGVTALCPALLLATMCRF